MNETLNVTINTSLHGVTSSAFSHDWVSIVSLIKPLALFILGITIYSFVIFKFYRYLAKKDLLNQHWHRTYEWNEGFARRTLKALIYLFEYVFAVPIIISFWFIFLAALILLLSNGSPDTILLMVMAIIGSIRITAYYDVNLSNDLAKMIPFALLGVFILDPSFLSWQSLLISAKDFVYLFDMFFYYLILLMLLEFALRIIHALFSKKEKEGSVEQL